MIAYALWSYFAGAEEHESNEVERRLSNQNLTGLRSVFLSAVGFLVFLDLAGDATEVLTILFVSRYHDAVVVFVGAVIALVSATAVETTAGNRLSKILSASRVRTLSVLIFLIIGAAAIASVVLRL
jgi:putative Ca2+/H+ antiporter (TMEM165/GDT1 family)